LTLPVHLLHCIIIISVVGLSLSAKTCYSRMFLWAQRWSH